MAVPLVDVEAFRVADAAGGPLPQSAREAARAWREAFASCGIAQVVGHGVPDDAIEAAYAGAKRFFALPAEEKEKCNRGLGYGAGGYNGMGVERVSATASQPDGSALLGAEKARPPDRVESFVFNRRETDRYPAGDDSFREATDRYFDELTRLTRTFMRITAFSLDLPVDYFDAFYFGEGGVGPERLIGHCAFRMAFYPSNRATGEPLPGQLRYGEHTDYTGFTILWQDHNVSGPQTARDGIQPPQGGLQARLQDGSWVDCPPAPGAFTVNSGDLIQVWTNDVYLSCMHRVLNPPAEDDSERISLVFFTGPSDDTLVQCLPSCRSDERPERYEPISSIDHLKRKLAASNK